MRERERSGAAGRGKTTKPITERRTPAACRYHAPFTSLESLSVPAAWWPINAETSSWQSMTPLSPAHRQASASAGSSQIFLPGSLFFLVCMVCTATTSRPASYLLRWSFLHRRFAVAAPMGIGICLRRARRLLGAHKGQEAAGPGTKLHACFRS